MQGEEEMLNRISECYKLMLEAGADCSLESHMGDGIWRSCFCNAISERCSVRLDLLGWCLGSYANLVQATLKHVISYGEPFINSRSIVKDYQGNLCSPLILLAVDCGYWFGQTIHIVEKAILLLKWRVDISCRLPDGDTVLHTILKCDRFHERLPRKQRRLDADRCRLSRTEPRELLIAFITAGADVYARNEAGHTPSITARACGREKEWLEALEFCGYDSKEVMKQLSHNCEERTRLPQTSKLSFEEYCQQREKRKKMKEKCRFEEVESEEEDEYSDEGEDSDEEEDSDEGEDSDEEEDSDEGEDSDEEEESDEEDDSDEEDEGAEHMECDSEESFAAVLENMDCENSNSAGISRGLLHDSMLNDHVEQIDRIWGMSLWNQ